MNSRNLLKELIRAVVDSGHRLEGAYSQALREQHNHEEWDDTQWSRIDVARVALVLAGDRAMSKVDELVGAVEVRR
jgi:hypothetical protein